MNRCFGPHRLALGLLLSVLVSIPAHAQAVEVKTYTGSDRQERLEAGARKEGIVQLYTTGTQIQPVIDRFQAKYPYLKVETYRGDPTEVARRSLEEFRAKRNSVDVIALITGSLRPLVQAGVVAPYLSPEKAAFLPEAIEKDGHWVVEFESYLGLGYNTREVPEDEVPRSYEDLLKPRWKGKLGVTNREAGVAIIVGAILQTKGEDFLRKLGAQDMALYSMSSRAVANLVVSGEVPLSPAIFNTHIKTSKEQGANVEWAAPWPVPAILNAVAVARNAPHPHAAMLFTDFLLSKEVQEMRRGFGSYSARKDVEAGGKPKEILYITERPDYVREYEQWTDLGKAVFGAARRGPGKN